MRILWDFDGTLFDTYPFYATIVQKIAGKDRTYEDIYSLLKISFGHAFNVLELTDQQKETVRKMKKELKQEDFKPFPHVVDVLKMADINVIVTHKDKQGVLNILKAHQMDHYFTEIVALEDGYRRKPDPESYDYLNEKYGIELVVGDRELDILPGKEVGMKTCLFQNQSAGADYYVDDYKEFFDIVRSL